MRSAFFECRISFLNIEEVHKDGNNLGSDRVNEQKIVTLKKGEKG